MYVASELYAFSKDKKDMSKECDYEIHTSPHNKYHTCLLYLTLISTKLGD
jgi:hypothetical protein